MKKAILIGWTVLLSFMLQAENKGAMLGEGVTLYPKAITEAPVIDGRLDEAVWQTDPLVNDYFITNHPVYGQRMDQKTRVWMAYDHSNIYLAFYCHDNEPEKIKASVSRRDNLFSDDWVGVDLDTLGNRQMVHEIICNPLGMQADLINTAAGGETTDPDWVWYSNGRVVSDGYTVEIRLPIKSFKFPSSEDVSINVAFYRFISRIGSNASWPQIDLDKGYFNSLRPTVLKGLKKALRLEALPTLTYGSLWDRVSPKNWSPADDALDLGIGVKYGLTSSIDLELTVNPDFSQVESDQFQVEANQRYPLFFNEKRPFFMDVSSQFNLSGLHQEGNFWTAVHTRQIVDPAWGGKISGSLGKTFLGFLAAGDDWPSQLEEGQGGQAGFYIGRLRQSLSGDSSVGLLYSGRVLGDSYNHVLAADAQMRLFGKHSLAMTGLLSFSNPEANGSSASRGTAASVLYQYGQKELDLFCLFEHMGQAFRMDSAFYQRTGIYKLTTYIGPKFYPEIKGLPWLRSINPFVYGFVIHDYQSGGDDFLLFPSLRFFLSRQSNIRFDYRFIREHWAGRDFNQRELVVMGAMQPSRWLRLDGRLRLGTRLYYDPIDPFLGRQFSLTTSLNLQPNARLTQEFEHTYQRFVRSSNDQLVYDLNLLVSRTTFQFNRYLFLRALIQYDSFRSRVLSDILASFTLIPGTVLHLGYGSLHQKRIWNDDLSEWRDIPQAGTYLQTRQTLFFKASYLYRF